MLDAYIIERIHRERDRARKQDVRVPLHIDRPPPEMPDPTEPDHPSEEGERGSVVIDFALSSDDDFLV
jgi:hypothetical protein